MSKSKPTQHGAVSHIIMGQSRAFLKVFLKWGQKCAQIAKMIGWEGWKALMERTF
jgi:hypothetical protein